MIRKNASELESGMTLAKPVYDMQGVLLLKEKTLINTKNIQVLKAWGVSRVWVEGEATDEERDVENLEKRDLKAIEEELTQRLGKEDLQDPVMNVILKTAVKLIAERTAH
jgi:hypothetical protein